MRHLLITLFLLSSLPALAAETPSWVRETHHNCKVWNERPWEGTVNPDYVLWWSGECKDGYASGTGYLQWISHAKNDSPDMPGLVFAQYDGEIVGGKLNGKGKLSLSTGEKYTGDFVNNEASGYGVDSYASGNRFEGLYVDGARSGHGTMYFNNGDRLSSEWLKDEKQDGFVTYDWANGDHFEGYEINNEPTGYGILIIKGVRHEGKWVDGKLSADGFDLTVHPIRRDRR